MLDFVPGSFLASDSSFSEDAPKPAEKNVVLQKEPSKILVVDDEQLIADTLAEILKRHGYAATACYDGKRALQVANRFQPDYLLADVLMPFMNGVELAIAIRKLNPQAKVLLFSGHANSSELIHEARQAGHIFEVVAKPIHPEKLMQLLREQR